MFCIPAPEKDEAARELSAARYDLQVAEGQRRAAEDAVLKGQGEVRQCEVLLEGVRANAENLEGEQEALCRDLRASCRSWAWRRRDADSSVRRAVSASPEAISSR